MKGWVVIDSELLSPSGANVVASEELKSWNFVKSSCSHDDRSRSFKPLGDLLALNEQYVRSTGSRPLKYILA